MLLGCRVLTRFQIDDVVGAVPVHLFAGVWGTLAVVFTNQEATIFAQLAGITSIGAFAFLLSFVVWSFLTMLNFWGNRNVK